MHYLFLGDDYTAKKDAIDEIKAQYLSSLEAKNFDYEVFYATHLDPLILEKAFLSLPAVGLQRIVLLHEVHKCSAKLQEIILKFFKKNEEKIILILDSDEDMDEFSFLRQAAAWTRVKKISKGPRKNVFDMIKAMERQSLIEALKILDSLIEEGIHPLQIAGGLVWSWGKLRIRLDPNNFQEGLNVLQKVDFHIKRSRLNASHALEIAVIKLTEIMNEKKVWPS